MTAAYIGLHALIAGVVNGASAGSTFGWFESSAKWGAVCAGLVAGSAVQACGVRAPFLLGALVIALAGCYLGSLAFCRMRLSNP